MQEEIMAMKAQPVHVGPADGLFNFLTKFWRHAFIDIHVQEPVTAGCLNTLISLMAEILAREAGR
jgi:hypothetical protein